jgi:tagatose-1,6-bisphosphate aldolase
MKITAKAEQQIPEISEDLLMIANASVDQRYELLKSMAQQKAGQNDWHCDAIRRWYPPQKAP